MASAERTPSPQSGDIRGHCKVPTARNSWADDKWRLRACSQTPDPAEKEEVARRPKSGQTSLPGTETWHRGPWLHNLEQQSGAQQAVPCGPVFCPLS